MLQRSHLIVWTVFGSVGSVFSQGCALSTIDDGVLPAEAGASKPRDAGKGADVRTYGNPDATKDVATTPDVATPPPPPVDAGRDTSVPPVEAGPDARDAAPDVKKDAPVEAAVDAGPPAPRPGQPFDPDPTLAEGADCPVGTPKYGIVERTCGLCGTQKSLCNDSMKIDPYGPCTSEKSGKDPAGLPYCLPGALEVSTCGMCGTEVRECDPYTCRWDVGLCDGEVLGGCVAGEVSYLTGLCPDPNQVRKQTCSATCEPGAPEPCATEPIDTLTIPTDGTTATMPGTFSTDKLAHPYSDSTCSASMSLASPSPYRFVLVQNTTTSTLDVNVWASTSSTSSILAVYNRTSRPRSDADIKACTGRSSTSGASAGFTGSKSLSIPASSGVVIGAWQSYSASTPNLPILLNVAVKVPPPPPPTVTIPGVGDTPLAETFILTSDGMAPRPLAGSCTYSITSSYSPVPIRSFLLNNTTSSTRTVEVWVETAADVVVMGYAGSKIPTTDAEIVDCMTSANDEPTGCPTSLSSDSTQACLVGADALSVPANGSVVVQVAGFQDSELGSGTLRIKTTK